MSVSRRSRSRWLPGVLIASLAWACQSPAGASDRSASPQTRPEASSASNGARPSDPNEVRVGITPDAVRLDGETVVELNNGTVPTRAKDGGEASLLIDSLLEQGEGRVQAIQKQDGEPSLHLAVRASVPYRTLTEVLYTMGQCGVTPIGGPYELVVLAPDGQPRTDVFRMYVGTMHGVPPNINAHEHQAPSESRKRRLKLHITVMPRGFVLAATGAVLPPRADCPEDGPTICLSDRDVDVRSLVDKARQAAGGGKKGDKRAARHLAAAFEAYDFKRLDRLVDRIETEYPDAPNLFVSTHPALPVGRVGDVLQRINRREGGPDSARRFPYPVLFIHRDGPSGKHPPGASDSDSDAGDSNDRP